MKSIFSKGKQKLKEAYRKDIPSPSTRPQKTTVKKPTTSQPLTAQPPASAVPELSCGANPTTSGSKLPPEIIASDDKVTEDKTAATPDTRTPTPPKPVITSNEAAENPLKSEDAALSKKDGPCCAYWHAATNRLTEDQRSTLEGLIVPISDEAAAVDGDSLAPEQVSDKSEAFNLLLADQAPLQLASLTAEKVKRLDDNAWRFMFRGRNIILRDLASKMILWMNKFKAVGDIAVNFDPVHAALPWAAIRFLLQAATAEQELAGHMLVGTEKSTCLLARCQMYRKLYLDQDTDGLTSAHQLGEALTCLYAEILSLLAHLVQLTNRSPTQRSMHATFNPAGLSESITKLEKLEWRIDAEASNCERESRLLSDSAFAGKFEAMQCLLEQQILLSEAEKAQFLKDCQGNERFEILQWISEIPYETDHYNVRSGRTEGTGEWLLTDRVYQDWRTTSASICLWLHGIPGAGKTKLSSKVVDDLLALKNNRSSDEGLAYFYCDRNREKHNEPKWILRSFVRQLSASQSDTTIVKCVRDRYIQLKQKGFASDLTQEDCAALLLELVNIFQQTTFIVDGLDECDKSTRPNLMNMLDELIRKADHPVKLFIASREDEDLAERYSRGDHLKVSASRNQGDIEKFVLEKMQTSSYCRVRMHESVRRQVFKTFREKSVGMFQWAALHIQELIDLERDSDVLKYLDELPVGLKAAYDKIYDCIVSQRGSKKDIAIAAIKWVLVSRRPFTPGELAIAACQDPDQDFNENIDIEPMYLLDACHNLIEWYSSGPNIFRYVSSGEAQLFKRAPSRNRASSPPLTPLDPSQQPQEVNSGSGDSGLISAYLNTDQTMYCRFSHLSVVEYLLTKWTVSDLHAFAARISLKTLLRFSVLDVDEYRHHQNSFQLHVNRYLQLSEAFNYIEGLVRWLYLRAHDDSILLTDAFARRIIYKGLYPNLAHNVRELSRQSPLRWLVYVAESWHHHFDSTTASTVVGGASESLKELLVVFFGHPVQGSPSYRAWVILYMTLAAGRRRVNGYILLGLQHFHPAYWCASVGYSDWLIKWIKEGTLDVNMQSNGHPGGHSTPELYNDKLSLIYIAVRNRQAHVCKVLFANGAKEESAGPHESILEMAIRMKLDDILELTLDNRLDIYSQLSMEGLLCVAAHAGTLKAVETLVERGADVNKREEAGPFSDKLTPLEHACLRPYGDIIAQFLTEKASDVNLHHSLALHLAAMTDKPGVVSTLCSLGADVEARPRFGSRLIRRGDTPLLSAIRQNLEARLEPFNPYCGTGAMVLLQYGADPNCCNSDGLAPLLITLDSLHHPFVVPLVQYGADLTKRFSIGTTVLQVVCRRGNVPLARFLIDHGADIDTISGPMRTALYAAFQGVISTKPFRVQSPRRYPVTPGQSIPREVLTADGFLRISEESEDLPSNASSRGPATKHSNKYFSSGGSVWWSDNLQSQAEVPQEVPNRATEGCQESQSSGFDGRSRFIIGDIEVHLSSRNSLRLDDVQSDAEVSESPPDATSNTTTGICRLLAKGKGPDALPWHHEPSVMIQLLVERGASFRADDYYPEMDENFQHEITMLGVLVKAYKNLLDEARAGERKLKDRFKTPFPRQAWEDYERRFHVRSDGLVMIHFHWDSSSFVKGL